MTQVQSLLAFSRGFSTPMFLLPDAPDHAKALQSGEFIFIYPYWYRAGEQGVIESVGKTTFSQRQWEDDGLSSEEVQLDLETLLDADIPPALEQGEVHAHLIHVTYPRLGFWKPGEAIQEGDYLHFRPFLYQVGKAGYLHSLGTFHFDDFDGFARGFTRLTSLPVIDASEDTLRRKGKVMESEEDINSFFNRMTQKQQGEFLAQCERLFGKPGKLHD